MNNIDPIKEQIEKAAIVHVSIVGPLAQLIDERKTIAQNMIRNISKMTDAEFDLQKKFFTWHNEKIKELLGL